MNTESPAILAPLNRQGEGGFMDKQCQVFPPRISEFSGFIVIQLIDGLAPPDAETLQEYACRQQLECLAAVLQKWNQPATRRAIWSLPTSKILELECRATENRRRKRDGNQPEKMRPPSLTRYWRLDARQIGCAADELLRDLNRVREVDLLIKRWKHPTPRPLTQVTIFFTPSKSI